MPLTKPQLTVILVVAGVLFVNAVFFVSAVVSSGLPKALDLQTAFAVLTVMTAVLVIGASIDAKLVGHGLAALTAVGLLIAGAAALASTLPVAFGTALLVLGLTVPTLIYQALRGSRAAWAFEVAIIAVLAIGDFFGAPKVKTALHIGLWYALMFPAYQVVAVFALGTQRRRYQQ